MTAETGFHKAFRVIGLNGRITFLAVLAVLTTVTGPLGAPTPPPALQNPPATGTAPQAHLLVRTGDPAPVQARVGRAHPWSPARLPDGGLLFVTSDESAIELRESTGAVRILLNTGDRIPECGTVSDILRVAAGADGTIAALVFCFATEAIVRVDAAGGPPVTTLRTGMTLPIGGTPVFISRLQGPAVDGQGRIVAAVDGGPEAAALVRQSDGAAPEILLQSGDPLGGGAFLEALREPAVNSGGMVAFSARISDGTEAIATLTPGEAPTVLFSVPVVENPPGYVGLPQPLALAPPALNDSGVVAFLWGDLDQSGYPATIRVRRAMGGTVETIAAAGDPAPGGDTYRAINWVYPAVDASGGVLFGATRSSQISGLYRFDGISTRVAERGQDTGGGEQLLDLDYSIWPLACADAAVRFAAYDTAGAALFAARDGGLSVELRAGEPMAEPARFVRFEVTGFSFPYLAAGPFMARGGAVIFDAWVSGRGRGLYARAADGTLSAVALDGDPAPGGGHFDGMSFSFHSIADGGLVAFVVGVVPDGPRPASRQLFAGVLGGPLTAVVGEGDRIAGFDAPIASLLPPSRINASGAIAVPVLLSDDRTVLLEWDGTALHVFAASGDTLPDGENIETIRTGQPDALLPPLLGDAGELLFGVVASSGHAALYRATLSGGIASAARVLGDGDLVEGGVLQPFLLQAMSSDAAGWLAFQAVPAPGPGAATYAAGGGGVPGRVAGPGDVIGPAVVIQALPRLAATVGGVVHETSSTGINADRVLWLATPRLSLGSGPAFDHTPLNQSDMPSPDGGSFVGGSAGVGPGGRPIPAERLGSDGDRYVVSLERTTAGPEDLVLFDLRPNQPPVADAGVDQTLECTGPEGAHVTLDARASSDPENSPLEYTWTGPFGTVSGSTPTVILPLGSWTISLTVRDAAGASGLDTIVVVVRDTVAPSVAVQAIPDRLWPPNGRLVPVSFVLTMQDLCDPAPGIVLESIVSNDPKADLLQDVSDAAYNTDDRAVGLRARRGGSIGGRTYTATYVATDHSGNRTAAAVTVLVQQDRGR